MPEVRRVPIMPADDRQSGPTSSSSSSTTTSARQRPLVIHRGQRASKHDQEYLTKKRMEVKTTKNTEKRVQRKVVLHDGRVLFETDPEVVVDTVEDHKTHDEDHEDAYDSSVVNNKSARVVPIRLTEPGQVVDDSFQRTVHTHDVKENLTKSATTNNVCGIVKRRDLDRVIREQRPLSDLFIDQGRSSQAVATKPRVIYTSNSHKKTVDTEDVHKISRLMDNGKVYTETFKTQQHEVITDNQAPDDDHVASVQDQDFHYKDKQGFKHIKNEDFTEYYRMPRAAKSLAEAELLGRGNHVKAEEHEISRGKYNWDEVSERMRQSRRRLRQKMHEAEAEAASRKDALTKRPLNYYEEEETRKSETDKWLERHFGSELSLNSIGRTHYLLNRTLNNSRNGVRRSMSFSSIPVLHKANDGFKTTTEQEKIIKTTTTTYGPGPRAREEYPLVSTTLYQKHTVKPTSHEYRVKANTTDLNRIRDEQSQRKYHSTQCLLPAPQLDYSLHGGSTVNEPVPPARPPRRRHHGGSVHNLASHHQHQQQQHHHHHHDEYHYDEYSAPMLDQQYFRSKSAVETKSRSRPQQTASSSYHQSRSHHRHHQQQSEDRLYKKKYRSRTETPGKLIFSSFPAEESYFRSESTTHDNARAHGSTTLTTRTKLRRSKSNGDHLHHHQDHQQQQQQQKSESKRQQHYHYYQHQQQKEPRYITEFRREKLFPTSSENNLLFDLDRHRNYHGYRSLERTDGVVRYDLEDTRLASASSASSKESKRRERRRSHSFAAKPHNEEYVYDRYEKRFVENRPRFSFLRHGHSDLRLDRSTPSDLKTKDYYYEKEEVDYHLQQDLSRLSKRQVSDMEPQRFKTIIFLSGHPKY